MVHLQCLFMFYFFHLCCEYIVWEILFVFVCSVKRILVFTSNKFYYLSHVACWRVWWFGLVNLIRTCHAYSFPLSLIIATYRFYKEVGIYGICELWTQVTKLTLLLYILGMFAIRNLSSAWDFVLTYTQTFSVIALSCKNWHSIFFFNL